MSILGHRKRSKGGKDPTVATPGASVHPIWWGWLPLVHDLVYLHGSGANSHAVRPSPLSLGGKSADSEFPFRGIGLDETRTRRAKARRSEGNFPPAATLRVTVREGRAGCPADAARRCRLRSTGRRGDRRRLQYFRGRLSMLPKRPAHKSRLLTAFCSG